MPDVTEAGRAYLDLVARRTAPDRILILAQSNREVDEFTDLIRTASARIHTFHAFCNQLLRANALDVGLHPRFEILGDAQRRLTLARLADAVLCSREADLSALGLTTHDRMEFLKDAVIVASDLPASVLGRPNDPRPFLEAFQRCCREIVSPICRSNDWPEMRLAAIRQEMPRALALAAELAGSRDGELDWSAFRWLRSYGRRLDEPTSVRTLDHAMGAALAALDALLAACLDSCALHTSGLIRDLAADVSGAYAAEKARLGALDFGDVITRARDLLLRNPDVAEMRRRSLDRVIVIGSEDLSPEHREIVRIISPQPSERVPPSPVLCGQPSIRRFIERLFADVWGEDRLPVPIPRANGALDDGVPAVEILLLPWAEVRNPDIAARVARDEARVIARRMLDMGGEFRYRDIVVLARSASLIRACEEAFEEHVIPVFARGGSIYDSREVLDVLAVMRAVEDPSNDVVLAEALLTPLAGISADSLTCLCDYRPFDRPVGLGGGESSGRLLRALQAADDILDIGAGDRSRLAAFRDMLRHLLEMRMTSGVSGIVEALLSVTRFDLRVLGMKGGRRRYANLRRFREIALEAQAGGEGLNDFLARIGELHRAGIRESEPPVEDEDADVVRVIHVRAAASIRAPIVFIAGMHAPIEAQLGFMVSDPEIGISARVVNPWVKRLETSLSYREIADRMRRTRVADEKSLFFDVMTRADQKLILVGASSLAADYGSTYAETSSWMGWVEKSMDLGPGTPEGDLEYGDTEVRLSFRPPKRIKRSDLPRTLATQYARELREGLPIQDSGISASAERVAREAFDRCTRLMPAPPARISRFSVSRILDYLQCPAAYRFLHIIGVPESGGDPREDDEEVRFSAADLGHAVHDILSRLDFARDPEPRLSELLASLGDDALAAETRPLVEQFIASRWAEEMRRADQLLVEVPFELTICSRVIAGRIDALYRDQDGWTVLDYKTGRAEDRDRYELQVGIYAHAVSRLLGEMPARVALLMLSIGEDWTQDTRDGAAASRAAEIIAQVIADTDAGRFDPKRGRHCDWCPAVSLCTKELPAAK